MRSDSPQLLSGGYARFSMRWNIQNVRMSRLSGYKKEHSMPECSLLLCVGDYLITFLPLMMFTPLLGAFNCLPAKS